MNASFATVLFAAIIASLIALPTPAPVPAKPAPKVIAKLIAKADRIPAEPAQPSCAQENWPNFSAACLRYTDDKQPVAGIRAVGDQS